MATTGPRGIALGLRAVRTLASSDVLDRLRMRDGATRVLYRATRQGESGSTAGGQRVCPGSGFRTGIFSREFAKTVFQGR